MQNLRGGEGEAGTSASVGQSGKLGNRAVGELFSAGSAPLQGEEKSRTHE